MLFYASVLVAGFGLLHLCFERARLGFGKRWGIEGVGDLAGLPLLVLLLSSFFFVLTPVTNTYVRIHESAADVFGLNAAREPDGMAEAALKLAEYRKVDPGPIEELVFYDHPSGYARIRMAMQWKAESGEARPVAPAGQVPAR